MDGARVRRARVLLPRDRAQPGRRRAVQAAQGVVFVDDISRSAAGRAGDAERPRHPRPKSSPRRAPPAAWSSTPCARSSRRCTTKSARAPARATPSSTSATPATTRPSARWRSLRSRLQLVQHADDVAALPDFEQPVALLAQTTLSHDEWSGVKDAVQERWPEVWQPGRSDLCFATTNRQTALRAIAAKSDAVLVVGSANSSNTVALERVARRCATACTASTVPTRCPTACTGVVGVTAGASAPEDLVDAVIARLAPARRRRGGRRSPRRTSTSRRRASCASCCAAASVPTPWPTTATSPPATCSIPFRLDRPAPGRAATPTSNASSVGCSTLCRRGATGPRRSTTATSSGRVSACAAPRATV